MTTTFRPLPLANSEIHWKEPRVGSSLTIADFLPAHNYRRSDAGRPADEVQIEAEIHRALEERRQSVRLFDPLENFVYSMISAAALTALLLGMLYSFDFARHLPSPSSEQTVLTPVDPPVAARP